MRKRSLKEILGYDTPTFMMGLAYEIVSYDEDRNLQTKRKGWVIPYEEMDIDEIDAFATKYSIPPRLKSDARKYWETEEEIEDSLTGEKTYYIMMVKNLDGSDISEIQFEEINNVLKDKDDDEDWGMTIKPHPFYV